MEELYKNIPIIFGFIAAFIHVVTGPDHIAAVGPIAINSRFRPWMIGMSWGIGHLIGMLIIGVLFYFFREFIPVEWISANSERLVGIMLIVIGIWGISRLFLRQKADHKHVHTHGNVDKIFIHKHGHEHSHNHLNIVAHAGDHTANHHHHHKKEERQTYVTALGIGILHGLAGVSHFLGVLPTMAFSTKFDSAMYLVGFGAGTIVAMMSFSILLGAIGKKSSVFKQKSVFNTISGLIGLAAIIIGFIWIWNTW